MEDIDYRTGETIWDHRVERVHGPSCPPLWKFVRGECTAEQVNLYRRLAESKFMLWPRGGVDYKHLQLNVVIPQGA